MAPLELQLAAQILLLESELLQLASAGFQALQPLHHGAQLGL